MPTASLYDGVSGSARSVSVEIGDRSLLVAGSEEVAADLLREVEGAAGTIRLSRTDVPGWRLGLPASARAELDGLLGRRERYGRWIDRVGLAPAVAICGLLTAVAVGIGYSAPKWLAPHIPMRWERNLGSAMVGDFGELRCRNPDGQKALEALVERVAPGATKGPDAIMIAALDVPMFNAAALPGGYIVVFKPAITESEPDALAGIVAHEIAHIRRRHVTEALVRELGIGALIRLFAGNVGANAEQIVSLSYTRDNEAQADADAIVMLRRAKISPRPTAALFRRLAKEQDIGLATSAEFLQSHPLSRRRAEAFEASFDPRTRYSPTLGRDDDDALFDICRHPVK